MCIVSAEKEQGDGHTQEEFLCRGILVAVVNLLPHVQVVICASIEFERHASHVVEHEVGSKHVADVGERPRDFLSDAWYDIEENLEGDDEDEVNGPGTYRNDERPD